MGIQINGQTDTITAVDGSFTLGGSVTANVTTTSGTLTVGTGATVHSPASNTLTLGTNSAERVRIDASGRIGINGTPNATLDVQASSAEIRLTSTGQNRTSLINGSSGLQISQTGAKNIIFETNANERLRITNTGNIGIGTDNPQENLHIYNSSGSSRIRLTSGNSSDCSIFFGAIDDSATGGIQYNHSDDSLRFNGYNNEERLRITSTGRVGIGTNVPGGTLHIQGPTGDAGQIYVTDGDAPGTGNSFLISKGGTTTTIKDRQALSNIDFGTADTHAVRIDSSQRVIIGSSNNNVNNDALQVNTAGGSNLGLSRFADNTGGPDLFLTKSRNTTPGNHTTVANGDTLGQVRFLADDGTNYIDTFRVFATVNGTVGTGSVPTDLIVAPGGTEKLRILSSGGITFNGDTAAANALDDYEEGTWTPTVNPSTGSPSIDSAGRSGTYTRIGRAVILFGRFQISATTSTGRRAVEISNLPFVQGENAAQSMGICTNYPKGDAHGHGGIVVNNTGSNNTTWYAEWYNDINQTVGSPVSFQITYYTS